jgi:hypothetical protein
MIPYFEGILEREHGNPWPRDLLHEPTVASRCCMTEIQILWCDPGSILPMR